MSPASLGISSADGPGPHLAVCALRPMVAHGIFWWIYFFGHEHEDNTTFLVVYTHVLDTWITALMVRQHVSSFCTSFVGCGYLASGCSASLSRMSLLHCGVGVVIQVGTVHHCVCLAGEKAVLCPQVCCEVLYHGCPGLRLKKFSTLLRVKGCDPRHPNLRGSWAKLLFGITWYRGKRHWTMAEARLKSCSLVPLVIRFFSAKALKPQSHLKPQSPKAPKAKRAGITRRPGFGGGHDRSAHAAVCRLVPRGELDTAEAPTRA